jgi:3-oxocholest-4-en-26-oyl-CoA dehydrogenase beta subunit
LTQLFSSIQCLGAMTQALEQSVKYASVREQFGRPIGGFQAVQHHCANMAMHVESLRLMAYENLYRIQHGNWDPIAVAMTKAAAARAVPEVTMLAHQIHGGIGVIEDHHLYFFTLRAKERSLAWGTVEECLATIAADIEQPTKWW